MNEFIITDIRTQMDYNEMSFNGYTQIDGMGVPSVELTLRPRIPDTELLRKLSNIVQAGRTVILNDAEYHSLLGEFKDEFIIFMNEKYPEKVLAKPESWDKLINF